MRSILMQEQILQCFAPKAILSNVSQVLQADGYMAIRADADFSYQINGTGPVATVAAGEVLGISKGIQSIDFQSPVSVLEVM